MVIQAGPYNNKVPFKRESEILTSRPCVLWTSDKEDLQCPSYKMRERERERERDGGSSERESGENFDGVKRF